MIGTGCRARDRGPRRGPGSGAGADAKEPPPALGTGDLPVWTPKCVK